MDAIKKILVPTDFSAAVSNGLEYAFNLAGMLDASLILYHSFTPLETGFYPYSKLLMENLRLEKQLIKDLNATRDTLTDRNRQVEVTVHLERGPVEIAIEKFCQHHVIDLIVMGTTGATGAKEVLIGSFASQVIRIASCPVLAIPPAYQFKVPRHIFFASDYSEADSVSLTYLVRLNETLHTELKLIHVVGSVLFAAQEDELMASYRDKLAKKLKVAELPYHIIQGEDTASALLEYTLREKADILAMTTSGQASIWSWLFHRSITRAAVHRAIVPILAFPSTMQELPETPDVTIPEKK